MSEEIVTIVLQEAPYGKENNWNALRLAEALIVERVKVRIFLYGDSVLTAKKDQATPTGFYNLGEMVKVLIKKGAEIRSCLTCTKARGLTQDDFVEGAVVGKTLDLARWIKDSTKVLSL
ncbi:MAG: DsrE family protein [Deltaproteobacteria bacterium]|nr:DsrE family protein [Deltaproteobacteria bacterium]